MRTRWMGTRERASQTLALVLPVGALEQAFFASLQPVQRLPIDPRRSSPAHFLLEFSGRRRINFLFRWISCTVCVRDMTFVNSFSVSRGVCASTLEVGK